MYTLLEIASVIDKSVSALDFKGEPKELYSPIEYMLSIGGKRIRPRLSLMAYNLFSDKIEKHILNPAMALEIFHGFTLIHDDIMDKADIRRGQATVHKKWNDNIAILSGDVMSIKSYQYIASAPSSKLPQVLELFSKTAAQVCEGQQIDMNYEDLAFITINDYLEMIGLKTAVLIACSAKMGALIAGANSKLADSLYNYGYQLGMAFQIQDDYLDVYGVSSIFGKKIGGDIVNNKKSWLLVECFRSCTEKSDKELLDKIMKMGEDRAEEKIELMSTLYEKLNIKEKAENEIALYHKKAIEAISSVDFEEEQIARLNDFASELINRRK